MATPAKPAIQRHLFRDTLTRSLLENDSKRLRALCDKLLEIAANPDTNNKDFLSALGTIMDRVDGRPVQEVDLSVDNAKPDMGLFKITKVQHKAEPTS